jgi:hypothetical protein
MSLILCSALEKYVKNECLPEFVMVFNIGTFTSLFDLEINFLIVNLGIVGPISTVSVRTIVASSFSGPSVAIMGDTDYCP